MKQAESNQQNQQKCDKCSKIVGCDYTGRKHKCNCKKVYACESCSIMWVLDLSKKKGKR